LGGRTNLSREKNGSSPRKFPKNPPEKKEKKALGGIINPPGRGYIAFSGRTKAGEIFPPRHDRSPRFKRGAPRFG